MTHINRPWLESFKFDQAFTHERLEQIHKLARNFACSADFGCPGVNHVAYHYEVNAEDYPKLSDAERYKLWVSQWKAIYKELSAFIRLFKSFRSTTRFPNKHPSILRIREWPYSNAVNGSEDALRALASYHLPRLAETAQVLLSSRYTARLAAGEARRRHYAKLDAAHVLEKAA